MVKVSDSIMNILRRFLAKLNEEGIRVESAYVFGSFAKGIENKWSDIDVAVISQDISDDGLEDMLRLAKIASKIDTRIEPVPYKPEDFIDEDPLVWEIKKEGIAIDPLSKEITVG